MARLTSKVKAIDDSLYIKHVFVNPNDIRRKSLVLLLHEVYVKATSHYHGWIIFGTAVNKPHLLANEQTDLFLDAIENAGENNFAGICDGNSVNQGLFVMFNIIELWHSTDDMFLVLDYVYLIKNISNNWITESYLELEFHADGKKNGLMLKHCTILKQNQTVKSPKRIEVPRRHVNFQKDVYKMYETFL